eukprot:m.140645 g.140645  ORF g.140645 m.140645 type:complete len:180 (-) comp10016_c0_seq1:457-996(-)
MRLLPSTKRFSGSLSWALVVIPAVFLALLVQTPRVQNLTSDLRFAPVNARHDPPTLNLLNFLNRTAPTDAIISGDPVILSIIKLVTKRRITVHPQVENLDMRLKQHDLFQLFNRITEDEVRHPDRGQIVRTCRTSSSPQSCCIGRAPSIKTGLESQPQRFPSPCTPLYTAHLTSCSQGP